MARFLRYTARHETFTHTGHGTGIGDFRGSRPGAGIVLTAMFPRKNSPRRKRAKSLSTGFLPVSTKPPTSRRQRPWRKKYGNFGRGLIRPPRRFCWARRLWPWVPRKTPHRWKFWTVSLPPIPPMRKPGTSAPRCTSRSATMRPRCAISTRCLIWNRGTSGRWRAGA